MIAKYQIANNIIGRMKSKFLPKYTGPKVIPPTKEEIRWNLIKLIASSVALGLVMLFLIILVKPFELANRKSLSKNNFEKDSHKWAKRLRHKS